MSAQPRDNVPGLDGTDPALGRIRQLATTQWGLLTRGQAVAVGEHPTDVDGWVTSGLLSPAGIPLPPAPRRHDEDGPSRRPDGYRGGDVAGEGDGRRDGELLHLAGPMAADIPGHPFPATFAAWLLLRPRTPSVARRPAEDGVLSHTTAARLYGALPDPPGLPFEVTLPPAVVVDGPVDHLDDPAVDHLAVVHRRVLTDEDWQWVDGLPVTRPSRTVMDLAVDAALDADVLLRMAVRLLRGGLMSLSELTAAVPPGADYQVAWLPAAVEAATAPGVAAEAPDVASST